MSAIWRLCGSCADACNTSAAVSSGKSDVEAVRHKINWEIWCDHLQRWRSQSLESSTPLSALLDLELCEFGQGSGDVAAGLAELQEEVKHLRGVEEEITGYAEQALEEAERLKAENEDLRKSAEDAALDK